MSLQHHTHKPKKGNTATSSERLSPKVHQLADAGQMTSAAQIMQLQRTVGNQAVQRMLVESLSFNPSQSPVQLAEIPEEELQMKADPNAIQRAGVDDEELQMKADPNAIQRAGVDDEELQMKADPNKMPENVQSQMENAFSADFSNVNIHQGNEASEVGALAYAQGNDIHFAPGQYDPGSKSGQELLGHELTHVVQQRQGAVKPTTQVNGLAVNDDPSLENEADQMGKKAAAQPEFNV